MKLEVPYYSQFSDVQNQKWQSRACGMTCFKMAMDFLVPGRLPSLDVLIEEGLIHADSMAQKGLFTASVSSKDFPHDVFVLMAHNYGVLAYREEFKSMKVDEDKNIVGSDYADSMLEDGLKKLTAMLETGTLPIVSVLPGLSQGKSVHTILLIGFEDREGTLTGFYYHDPDARTEARNDQFITLEEFVKYWRKMSIFIG